MSDRSECLEILAQLVSARTENPPGNETAAAAVVERFFQSYGIPYRTYAKSPDRANVIGAVGNGRPIVLVACHLDTVPAGSGWDSDPFTLRVDGDRAYGRGVCDNKGPMAAAIIAARRLAARPEGFEGTMLVAGVADEEAGNEYGATYLVNETGLRADYSIVPDSPSLMREIDVAEKGAVWLSVTAHGRAAHGSRPWEGRNAIVYMSRLVELLQAARIPSPPHPAFTPATMNIGKISGGIAPNAVPETCRIDIDFRTLPGMADDDIYGLVEDCIAGAKASFPEAAFTVEKRSPMPPHEIDLGSKVVDAVQEASRSVYGRDLKPLYQGGITLAKEFTRAGIPSVALGPGEPGAPHTANESIDVGELLSFAEFLVVSARIIGSPT